MPPKGSALRHEPGSGGIDVLARPTQRHQPLPCLRFGFDVIAEETSAGAVEAWCARLRRPPRSRAGSFRCYIAVEGIGKYLGDQDRRREAV